MTDDESQNRHGGAPPPIIPPPAGFAPPAEPAQPAASAGPPGFPPPPAYGPPQGSGPPPWSIPAHGQAGWTPPPRPGLIPLAPLTFGTILGAPYRLFRKNPRPTFGMSLVIQFGIAAVTAVVIGLVVWASFNRVGFAATPEDQLTILSGAIGAIVLASSIPVALSIVATGIMQGIIVLEVSRQTLGEKLTFRSLWARGRGRLWALAGYSLLLTLAAGVALAAVIVVTVVPSVFGEVGVAIGFVAVAPLLLGLAAAALWLWAKLAFVPSVIVLERTTIVAAIGRSWRLTRGSFWRILGTILLVFVILQVASQLVSIPVSFAGLLVVGVFAPTGDESALITTFVIMYVLLGIVSLVIAAIALVVQSATNALLYLDQRIRKEGLDLDLLRFVESRQSGASDLRDPYETADPRSSV